MVGARSAAAGAGESTEPLVKEIILGYYTSICATIPEVEVEKIKAALRPVREMYGNTPAASFGPVAFQAVRKKLIDSGLSISTIRDRMGIIKRMIAWGLSHEVPRSLYEAPARGAPAREETAADSEAAGR